MSTQNADLVVPDPAETFHPFEYVLDELEARKISPDMAGRMLQRMAGIKYLEWMEFIAGGRVDDRLAAGLARLFGTGSEVWLKLQRAYDLQHNDGKARATPHPP